MKKKSTYLYLFIFYLNIQIYICTKEVPTVINQNEDDNRNTRNKQRT